MTNALFPFFGPCKSDISFTALQDVWFIVVRPDISSLRNFCLISFKAWGNMWFSFPWHQQSNIFELLENLSGDSLALFIIFISGLLAFLNLKKCIFDNVSMTLFLFKMSVYTITNVTMKKNSYRIFFIYYTLLNILVILCYRGLGIIQS